MRLDISKILTLGLFTILSLNCLAQGKSSDTNFIDPKGRRQGVWKKIDTTGLSYIGQFKDNKPFGRFTYFDKYGRTVTISDFFRDGFATKTTHYYPNGKVRATGFYLDKMRDSIWNYYDSIGHHLKMEHYLNGMLHGPSELYDYDGNCVEETQWYRNLRNGFWWEKSTSGTQSNYYKFNLSDGFYATHYPDGTDYIKGVYKDGLKEDIWYFYHADGSLDRVLYFKHNKQIKKLVSIRVDGKDILLDTDSVAYVHTNRKITQVKMLDNTVYKPSQTFEMLVKSFGTDFFFLATPLFLAPYSLYSSMEMLPEDDAEELDSEEDLSQYRGEFDVNRNRKAILKLKIPTPYEVVINAEVIGLLESITSTKPIEDYE